MAFIGKTEIAVKITYLAILCIALSGCANKDVVFVIRKDWVVESDWQRPDLHTEVQIKLR